jgi:hypothetical protein
LKPEFGHFFCPSPNLRHKLSLALAFTVLGLVACTSGVALLVADYDPDPRSAFALAPLQSPSRATAAPAATADMPAVDTVLAQKVTKADGIKSCRRNASNEVGANCDTDAAQKPAVVHTVTDPPAAAGIPIGHGNGPAVGAPEPAVLVASTPALEGGTPASTDAAPPSSLVAEAPAPEGSATTPRKAARHQSRRRYPYADSSLWAFDHHYRRGGYARQRPWMLFW